ncbi:CapA family protein [Aeromonas veronii]|uniref:CapA family protein n=1 Tax=Aeromonas veronii TaxID=654 RepID=UPI003D1902E9
MNRILFLGDICSHGYTKIDGESFKNNSLGKFLYNYEGVIVGNLEAPTLESNIVNNKNKFSLLNPPSNKSFYEFCDVVTLANNHIFDQGLDGYQETVNFLNELDIKYIGAGDDINQSRKPIIINLCSKKVALLAYNCYSTNSSMNADYSTPGTAPLLYDFIKQDIRNVRDVENVDLVIILPHWGIENQFYPTAEQVCFARSIIDCGADAIIGSHTHSIQVSERYNNKSIYYSLGNFLFNNFKISDEQFYYQSKFNKEGLVVEVSIEDNMLSITEHFIKFDDQMIPDFSKESFLSTPISKNNLTFSQKIKTLNCKKCSPELSLAYRFNGRSAQVVYTSVPVDISLVLTVESLFSKLKRLIMYRLRRLLQ